jgi:hypothetical protein
VKRLTHVCKYLGVHDDPLKRVLATFVIAAASFSTIGATATAAGPAAPKGVSSTAEVSNDLTASALTDDGVKVEVTVDTDNQELIIKPEGQSATAVPLSKSEISQFRASAQPGAISPMKVSKETCANLLKVAGYSNAVVWMLAAAISSPTVAGSIIAGSAGLVTTAMITEASALC